MKKLMIAAAIVCAAAFANAAVCSWNTKWVWTEGADNYTNGGVGNYFLIALGTTDVGGYAISTDKELVYNDGTGYAKVTSGFTKGDIAGGAAGDTFGGLSAANNGDLYALIYLDTENNKWGISGAEALTGIQDSPSVNADPITFGNYVDVGWNNNKEVVASQDLVAVPEPTSGLLLLLGVAGLALRRRRA